MMVTHIEADKPGADQAEATAACRTFYRLFGALLELPEVGCDGLCRNHTDCPFLEAAQKELRR